MPTRRNSSQKEVQNGTEVKSPKCTSTVSKKAMQQLQRAGIASDLNKRRDMALYYLKATGEYNPAVCEWENKATADKTWPNIKIFISNKYVTENKQPRFLQNNSKPTSSKNRLR